MLKKRLLILGALFASTMAQAESLRLEEYVSVKDPTFGDGNQSVLQAFRSQAGCRIWYYLPGRHVAYGSAIHTTYPTAVKVGEQYASAYLTSIEMQTTPGINQGHIQALREKIAEYLHAVEGECKDPAATAANIVLNPALVKARPGVTKSTSNFYMSMHPTYETDKASYFDPSNPTSLTWDLDASSPKTKTYIESIFLSSANGPVELGTVDYMLDGILNSVDSTLHIDGTMDAEFDSRVQLTSCTVSSSNKNLSTFAAAGSLAAAGMGFANIGYSESSSTCSYNLITEFKGGAYKSFIKIDHSRSKLDQDGNPIVIQVCGDKAKCDAVPLQDFVETQLMALMLMTNFDINIKKLADNTFNVTLGRKGSVNTKFDVTAEYLRSFHGTYGLAVKVYGNRLPKSDLDFSFFKSPELTCAQSKYAFQAAKFGSLLGSKPLPVHESCAGGGI